MTCMTETEDRKQVFNWAAQEVVSSLWCPSELYSWLAAEQKKLHELEKPAGNLTSANLAAPKESVIL